LTAWRRIWYNTYLNNSTAGCDSPCRARPAAENPVNEARAMQFFEDTTLPLHVLAVDDNRDAADSLCRLLELWGYRATAAYDAPSALAAVRRDRPDAVLLDLGLPGMDGWELARRLRAEPGGEGVLLVAVTGHGREADRRASDAAGIDHHLVKPTDPHLLRLLLEDLGERRGTAPVSPSLCTRGGTPCAPGPVS
jgi:CheY-like chemotaxis protein